MDFKDRPIACVHPFGIQRRNMTRKKLYWLHPIISQGFLKKIMKNYDHIRTISLEFKQFRRSLNLSIFRTFSNMPRYQMEESHLSRRKIISYIKIHHSQLTIFSWLPKFYKLKYIL